MADGSIVGWGDNYCSQATPPEGNDFVAIAAGWIHSLALKADGFIVAWGNDWYGQATPPDGNDFIWDFPFTRLQNIIFSVRRQ